MYIESNPKKKYLEQWKRVKRYHTKVLEISRGGRAPNDEESLDVIISFFLHCYHLKDWVCNSNTALKNDLETLFSKEDGKKSLFLCRNIAQGAKHLTLNDPQLNSETRIAHQNVTVYLGTGTAVYSWDIAVEGEKVAVYPLVEECMREWEEFLSSHSLQLGD